MELGAGTGLAGLAAAKHGFSPVLLTDLPCSESLLKKNVARNDLGETCEVLALDWTKSKDFLRFFGVILLADVVYYEATDQRLWHHLVGLLQRTCTTDTRLVMCYKERDAKEKLFFSLLREAGFMPLSEVAVDEEYRIFQFQLHVAAAPKELLPQTARNVGKRRGGLLPWGRGRWTG